MFYAKIPSSFFSPAFLPGRNDRPWMVQNKERFSVFLQDRIFILHFNQFYTVFTLTKCKIPDMILQFYRIAGFENLPAEFLGP